nr:MAG TPA: hypothetical protein [Caudoviricetes sp.]DAK13245.1 MAG TPA: hypothetical protein [Crassvirales sp.]
MHIGNLATKAARPGLHELGKSPTAKNKLGKTVLVGATRRILIYKQT